MKMKCLRICLVAGLAAAGVSTIQAQTNLPAYADAFVGGWQNWSWAVTSNTTRCFHGGSLALAVTAGAWQAAYFGRQPMDSTPYSSLEFWLHGGSSGGQKLLVQGLLGGKPQLATNLPPLPANAWRQFTIPLAALGVDGADNFDGFWIQDRTGQAQSTFYLDDVVLRAVLPQPPTTNAPAEVVVDVQGNRHPISPLIYGLAFASSQQLTDLNCPLNRSGGNSESRYNWQVDAHNRGADWYFESLSDGSGTPGADADSFISSTRAAGAEAMLTIPTVGWVAKLGSNRQRLASYSIAKYGAQTGSDSQWFADAGNGIRASDEKEITWNDPNDANVTADVSFERGWVRHLTNRWGRAGGGGVNFYLMDNEPSLWHSTHRDVHPTGASMREVRDKFFDYAGMVKGEDPAALVGAPEEWGWSGYFYSGLDQQTGATNNWSRFPDRSTNGGWDYLPWFLDQVRQRAEATGRRLLDYFTVHYYPQGGEYGGSASAAMQLVRNRSTRSLWDTNYVDESWIDEKVMLIPRLKRWVAAYYPGTKIGITEYNWGAESHLNGATAQADLLGIFGREGLDLATRWTTPASNSPAYNAIKLFRNYDGSRSCFGDVSVRAAGPNPDELAVFAAERSGSGDLTVMLVHKRSDVLTPVTVRLTNGPSARNVQVWQLTSSNRMARLPDLSLTNIACALTLSGASVTLLVIPAEKAPRLRVGSWQASGQLDFWLESEAPAIFVIQSSSNLVDWLPVRTNTAPTNVSRFVAPAPSGSLGFYRAMRRP